MSENYVHVLIPTYNVRPFIHSSLTSVTKQDYEKTLIIILDDGSTDGTKEVVTEFISHYNNFIFVSESDNRGISARREQLVSISKRIDDKSFFIWLDADDSITDKRFISKLVDRMITTKAEICLYNFSVTYENSSEQLKDNSKLLLADQSNSEEILSEIVSRESKTVSVESYPKVATFTSLGWTKAYAHSVKRRWPKSNHLYLYEDFVYMAALFQVDNITAFDPSYKPISYLRRSQSVTGKRTPAHFYNDVVQQLVTFKSNLKDLSPSKQNAVNLFISSKLKQYRSLLINLINVRTEGFSEEDLKNFEEASNILKGNGKLS